MRDKYAATQRSTVRTTVKKTISRLYNRFPNSFVKPLYADETFVFVCGCGHSGTTLTAAKLGNHKEAMLIATETNLFTPPNGLFVAREVVQHWTYFAKVNQRKVIIEKTPKHVHEIGLIKDLLPEAKIICLTRNPIDNVASLYRRLGNLDLCIERWNVDNQAVCDFAHHDYISVVKYESLVESPGDVLKELSEFSTMSWDQGITNAGQTRYDTFAQQGNMLVRAGQVRGAIVNNNGKWRDILDQDQVVKVFNKTRKIASRLGYAGEQSA